MTRTPAVVWACGAPLDVRNLISESGWREAPRIKDMTEIHLAPAPARSRGGKSCRLPKSIGQGDSIYFEHHVMFGKRSTHVRNAVAGWHQTSACRYAFHNQPLAHGPGRIAFSETRLVSWWFCHCIPEWN